MKEQKTKDFVFLLLCAALSFVALIDFFICSCYYGFMEKGIKEGDIMKLHMPERGQLALSAVVPCICFVFCVFTKDVAEFEMIFSSLFILSVLITAVFTDSIMCDALAIALSLLCYVGICILLHTGNMILKPEGFFMLVCLCAVMVSVCFAVAQLKAQAKHKTEAEKEKMRANFLRAVSHDLRTPLTTIYGASSALLEHGEDLSDNQKTDMLSGIQKDATWLFEMVENLLSITRLDGASVKITKMPTVLEELVDSALLKFSKRYPDIRISVDIPEEIVIIPMDALLIQQVILNILENSVKHAKGMTQLSLKVFANSELAIFEIKYDGCGIPEDRLKNIFSGIYDCSGKVTESKKQGAGIGLSVCATIIKAHEGEIYAENLRHGGACFRFILNMTGGDDE